MSLGSLEWRLAGRSHTARERPLWRVRATSPPRSLFPSSLRETQLGNSTLRFSVLFVYLVLLLFFLLSGFRKALCFLGQTCLDCLIFLPLLDA